MNGISQIPDAVLQQLAAFARREGGPLFAGWAEPEVQGYLLYHMRQRTCAWARTAGTVDGLGIAWQADELRLRAALAKRGHAFDGPTDPRGDTLFLGEWACASREAGRALAAYFDRRFPAWQSLKLATMREDQAGHWHWKELKAATLARWKGDYATKF